MRVKDVCREPEISEATYLVVCGREYMPEAAFARHLDSSRITVTTSR
jgi:hypothetical protein